MSIYNMLKRAHKVNPEDVLGFSLNVPVDNIYIADTEIINIDGISFYYGANIEYDDGNIIVCVGKCIDKSHLILTTIHELMHATYKLWRHKFGVNIDLSEEQEEAAADMVACWICLDKGIAMSDNAKRKFGSHLQEFGNVDSSAILVARVAMAIMNPPTYEYIEDYDEEEADEYFNYEY